MTDLLANKQIYNSTTISCYTEPTEIDGFFIPTFSSTISILEIYKKKYGKYLDFITQNNRHYILKKDNMKIIMEKDNRPYRNRPCNIIYKIYYITESEELLFMTVKVDPGNSSFIEHNEQFEIVKKNFEST
jgi:hypothetical protein